MIQAHNVSMAPGKRGRKKKQACGTPTQIDRGGRNAAARAWTRREAVKKFKRVYDVLDEEQKHTMRAYFPTKHEKADKTERGVHCVSFICRYNTPLISLRVKASPQDHTTADDAECAQALVVDKSQYGTKWKELVIKWRHMEFLV